jgi:hypothetical protein
MGKQNFNHKSRQQHDLLAWRRKLRDLRARRRKESASAFNGEAFLTELDGAFMAEIAGVCVRHGVPVYVPQGILPSRWPDNQPFRITLGLEPYTPDSSDKQPEGGKDESQQAIFFFDQNGFVCGVFANANGDPVVERLHEFIAKRGVPNPENKTRVRHKNGDKSDNTRENLEWY